VGYWSTDGVPEWLHEYNATAEEYYYNAVLAEWTYNTNINGPNQHAHVSGKLWFSEFKNPVVSHRKQQEQR